MKRLMCILAVFAIMVGLAGCGSEPAPSAEPEQEETASAGVAEPEPELEPEPVFDLEAYEAAVCECRENISVNTIVLGGVITYEISYLKAAQNIGNDVDAEDVSRLGFEYLTEKNTVGESIDTVNARHDTINEQYREIILTEIDGKEAEEVDTAFREMYDGYKTAYDIAFNPTVSSMKSNSDVFEQISDANDTLNMLMGTDFAIEYDLTA